jgi:hypothetical protein
MRHAGLFGLSDHLKRLSADDDQLVLGEIAVGVQISVARKKGRIAKAGSPANLLMIGRCIRILPHCTNKYVCDAPEVSTQNLAFLPDALASVSDRGANQVALQHHATSAQIEIWPGYAGIQMTLGVVRPPGPAPSPSPCQLPHQHRHFRQRPQSIVQMCTAGCPAQFVQHRFANFW